MSTFNLQSLRISLSKAVKHFASICLSKSSFNSPKLLYYIHKILTQNWFPWYVITKLIINLGAVYTSASIAIKIHTRCSGWKEEWYNFLSYSSLSIDPPLAFEPVVEHSILAGAHGKNCSFGFIMGVWSKGFKLRSLFLNSRHFNSTELHS